MAGAVAIAALTEKGNRTEFIHHGSNTNLDELGVITIAMRDVSRGDIPAASRGPGSGRRSWLRRLIGSVEDEVGGIEVEAVAGEVGELEGLDSDSGEDGVTLTEEGIEGTAQAVVVEALRR